LQPADAASLDAWLFADHIPHIEGFSVEEDYKAWEQAVRERRRNAVAAVESQGGLQSVLSLADTAEPDLTAQIGIALADAVGDKYTTELLSDVGANDGSRAAIASGWLTSRFEAGGWEWIDLILLRDDITDGQRAEILLSTHDFPEAWHRAEGLGAGVDAEFWRSFSPYGLGQGFEYVDDAVGRLAEHGRVAAALRLVVLYLMPPQAARVTVILELMRAYLGSGEVDPVVGALSRYDFTSLFAFLNTHAEADCKTEIAELEWSYLPAIGYEPKLAALQHALLTDPAFFVRLLEVLYRPTDEQEREQAGDEGTNEADEPDAYHLRVASNAYRLLRSIDSLPGTSEDGRIDPDALGSWVTDVLERASSSNRLDVAKQHVGALLANAPSDPDGVWPCQTVRDFIEDLHSEHVDDGFRMAIFNRRGVTSRGLQDGGGQEMALVEKYRQAAASVADGWPRTAAVLRSLATAYESEARREELSAERFRRGLE
jgi:hypothetical protein